jgi:hypothetical protein
MTRVNVSEKVVNIYKSTVGRELLNHHLKKWVQTAFLSTQTAFTNLIKLNLHKNTSQIDHQPDPTIFQFIILTFIYSSTCFGCSPAHHREFNDCSSSLWFYLRFGRPARPRTQHDYHRDTKVKPEAATAVVELPMMGRRTPETC